MTGLFFFSYQELPNENTMSFVRQFLIFDFTVGAANLLGPGWGTQRRAAIFGQCVSGMTGFTLDSLHGHKVSFLGHPYIRPSQNGRGNRSSDKSFCYLKTQSIS